MLAIADEQHPSMEPTSTPRLVVSSVQRSPVIRIKGIAAAPLKSPASALAWLNSNRILVSTGNTLSIFKLNESVLRMRSQLPAFHTDDIRDVQVAYRAPCRLRPFPCVPGCSLSELELIYGSAAVPVSNRLVPLRRLRQPSLHNGSGQSGQPRSPLTAAACTPLPDLGP